MAHSALKEGRADVSSAACEIYGAANATFGILHIGYCAEEMGVPFQFPFTLNMDNEACLGFQNNSVVNSRLRHIDQRQHWVTTLRDHNLVKGAKVPTKENVADIFTKPLTGQDFRHLRNKFLHDCAEVCIKGEIDNY